MVEAPSYLSSFALGGTCLACLLKKQPSMGLAHTSPLLGLLLFGRGCSKRLAFSSLGLGSQALSLAFGFPPLLLHKGRVSFQGRHQIFSF